jgi:RING-variant domain
VEHFDTLEFNPYKMATPPPEPGVSEMPSVESTEAATLPNEDLVPAGNPTPPDSDVSAPLDADPPVPLDQDDVKSSSVVVKPEKKTCWICLTEEGEELPNKALDGRWSRACDCSLNVHESCLISWISQYRGPDTDQTVSPSKQLHKLTIRSLVLNVNNHIELIRKFRSSASSLVILISVSIRLSCLSLVSVS